MHFHRKYLQSGKMEEKWGMDELGGGGAKRRNQREMLNNLFIHI